MRSSAIRHLAAARRAPCIAAALFERTVQLWDVQTGEQLSEFDTLLSYGGRRLALSPNGDYCVATAWTKGERGGVACYDAMTGEALWHRADLCHTQRIRFAPSGGKIWCGFEEGPLQELSVSTGETLDKRAGLLDIIDEYPPHQLLDPRSGDFVFQAAKLFRIPRLTVSLLDAVFGSDALCLSEAGGPVRCIDVTTGGKDLESG